MKAINTLNSLRDIIPELNPTQIMFNILHGHTTFTHRLMDLELSVQQPLVRDKNMVASYAVSEWQRNRGIHYMVDEDLYAKLREEPEPENKEHMKEASALGSALELWDSLTPLEKKNKASYFSNLLDQYYDWRKWQMIETLPDFRIEEPAFVQFPDTSEYLGALVLPCTGWSPLDSVTDEKLFEMWKHVSLDPHPTNKSFIYYNGLHEYRAACVADFLRHAHSFHKNERVYTVVLIYDKSDFLVTTMCDKGVAANTQNLAVDELRFLYNFFYCLTRKTTVVGTKRYKVREKVGPRNKKKVVRKQVRTITVDDETLSVVKKKNFTGTRGEGSSKCKHERSATKAKVWVKGSNLIQGEEVISTKTSTAGNKLFLVRRSRSGAVVNSHLEDVPVRNSVVKVRSLRC